jgi:hypothetical protein
VRACVCVCVCVCVILEISVVKGSFICFMDNQRKVLWTKTIPLDMSWQSTTLKRDSKWHEPGLHSHLSERLLLERKFKCQWNMLSHVRDIQLLPEFEVSSEIILQTNENGSQK